MQREFEDESFKRLVFAVFWRAIEDVQIGYLDANSESEAAAWLLSTGQLWLVGLGIDVDPKQWASWIEAGCPGNHKRSQNEQEE